MVLVAHPDAEVLEVPDELGEYPPHVAGVHDHLVVLGAEDARDVLRVRALVEHELEAVDRGKVEASGERHQPRDPL